MKVILSRKTVFIIVLFLLTYTTYFSFGLYHLSEFETADERFWVEGRIPQYWRAMMNQKWKMTYINDKPGITLAIISGIRYPFAKVKNYEELEQLFQEQNNNQTSVRSKVLFFYRLPILIFNGFFCLFLFWIIKVITNNKWIAFWSFILILLSPTLLGMSQIANPDSFLWVFSTATLLSFIALLKTGEKKFVFLSSLFLGLSLLSKYTAAILFPFLLAAAVIFHFIKFSQQKTSKELIQKETIKMSALYFLIIAGSLAVFSLLMPAVFSNIRYLIDGTIGYPAVKEMMLIVLAASFLLAADAVLFKSEIFVTISRGISKNMGSIFKVFLAFLTISFLIVIVNWNTGLFIVNPEKVVEYSLRELDFTETSSLYEKIIYQFYPLVFSLTPLVVFSLLFLWSKYIFKKTENDFLALILSLFIVIYCGALIFEKLPATPRYGISLYPLASILAAIGICELFSLEKLKRLNKNWVTLAIIALSFISLWQIKPFYFNYANILLPKKYILSGSWGYGGYEAAQFLNSLPNAENLVVWSDYIGFSKFFKGKTYKSYISEKDSRPVDFYVLTRQGENMYNYWCNHYQSICEKKYVPARKYYGADNPVWELLIDGRPENFIKIYKAED